MGANETTRSRVVVKFFSQETFPEIPEPPSVKQVVKELRKLDLPARAVELAEAEHKTALILDKADSKARAKIRDIEGATLFPQGLKCGDESESNSGVVEEKTEKKKGDKTEHEEKKGSR